MAEDGRVVVGIKVTSENKGAEDTERSLDKVGKKAGELEKETKTSGDGIVGAMGRMRGSIEKVRAAIMNLGGLGAIVTGLVAAFKSWRGAAREVAAEIEAIKAGAAQQSVKELAEAERSVAEAIERGRKAREDALEIDRMRIAAGRELEDAELEQQKTLELAGVVEGPDKDLDVKRIEEKYAGIAAGRSRDRSLQDLSAEADAKRQAAADAREEVSRLNNERDQMSSMARDERRRASSAAAAGAKAAANGRWWRFWGDEAETAEQRIKESQAHGAVADSAEAKAAEYEARIRAAEARAARLEQEAGVTDARREAVIVRSDTERIAAGHRSALIADEQQRRDIARKRDFDILDGSTSERARIQGQIDAAREGLRSADVRRQSVLMDVQQGRALGKVSSSEAQTRIRAAEQEFAKVQSEVGKRLEGLVEAMKEFERRLAAAQSRQRVNIENRGEG